MIKNTLNQLLKFPAPIFTAICSLVMVWFNDNMFTDNSSDLQMALGMTALMLNMILWVFVHGILKDCSKLIKIINYSTLLIVLGLGIFLLRDYKQRPNQYELSNNTTITQTKANSIIVETPYVIFSYKLDEVKFDSLHPLKAYSCYKVDIFGDKTPGYLCVKSDLMNEYKFTSFTRK